MRKILFLILSFLFYSKSVFCYEHINIKEKNSKQPLPYFRRKVEEVFDETSPSVQTEDPNNIVSFLFRNVKEIFKDAYNDEDSITHIDNYVTVIDNNNENKSKHLKSSLLFRPTVKHQKSLLRNEESSFRKIRPMEGINDLIADILLPNSTIYHTNKTEDDLDDTILSTTVGLLAYENIFNSPMPFLSNKKPSKDLLFLGKPEQVQKMKLVKVIGDDPPDDGLDNVTDSLMLHAADTELGEITTKRSCIMCNNVAVDHCGNPKYKLIPSTLCSAEEDFCYSLHTPFGIVDRGCFNLNSNMTTYVCACNLCNYMSITSMPLIFASKQEWISNIYELTHTQRLRGSVLKDISCLRCEANTTAGGDPGKNSACLEGHIASLASQVCKENEICAVSAIKSQGYVWRGCVSFPLFNYYLTFCDSDLCNYDTLASVFDSD